MQKKRIIILTISILSLCLFLFFGYGAYLFWGNNANSRDGEPHDFYICPSTSPAEWEELIATDYTIRSRWHLRLHARLLSMKHIHTGHYRLPAHLSDNLLIRTFRNGAQTPINITFNNIRLHSELASTLSRQLLLDSAAIASVLTDSTFVWFLPNTYQVYWTISAENLLKRMQQEYAAFWNTQRTAGAAAIGLSPYEVMTLASIIEEETNRTDEWPIIAGLYLNRLKLRMPLQACPTIKYALQDFGLQRVLYEHLQVASPYNTYRNIGLPPTPIRLPSIQAIDAVLHYQKSNYLYMCADWQLTGQHRFAATLAEHNRNARLYQQQLNRMGIKPKSVIRPHTY